MFNLVARDLQTTTARNIRLLQCKSGTDPWTVGLGRLRERLVSNEVADIPHQEAWKVEYLGSLLRQMQEAKYLAQVDRMTYIQGLVDSLVK